MTDSNGMDKQPKKYDSASKRAAYLIAGVVVLILAALGVYSFTHRDNESSNTAQSPVQQDNASTTPVLAGTSTPPSSPAVRAKLSYGDAIKAYPSRFQFSQCQGTPSSIVIKKGSPVMLDNRDAVAHTIKADTQTFKLAGYDYAVLYPEVLGNLVVTCDGKNRVMLNVEK